MKNLKLIIILLVSAILFKQQIFAQAGTLDPGFGEGGVIIVSSNFNSYKTKSLIQPDGKILLYGVDAQLDRFNPDGTYDLSFGVNGRIAHNFNNSVGCSQSSFALRNDGKIICIGVYYPLSGNQDACVFRCNTDGSLDSSFGIKGLDTVEIDAITYATGVVVQPDGKIVVSGDLRKSVYDDKRTFIYRLMPDGGLDSSFGINGIVVSKRKYSIHSVALLLRPDGKLVIGSTYKIYFETPSYQLESFNEDGSRDSSFGTLGVANFTFGEGSQEGWFTDMRAMKLQPDGKIICAGTSGTEYWHMALCRINIDGSADLSFGDNGSVITGYMDIKDVENFDLSLQPNGKIVTCGLVNTIPVSVIIARYNENGDLDSSFGINGITTTQRPPDAIGGKSVHSLTNGKILVTGFSGLNFLLARYNGDNVLAANFKEVKAIQENDNITITWQTLNENNTKSYTVERSNNAKDYAGINTIPAKHAATNSYSYTDKNPLYGDNYYRIKENAANGSFTYSQTLKVVFENGNNISLYPNPAKNTVTVKGLNKNATAVIKITDMNGREISKKSFSNPTSTTLSIRALAQGSYFVLVEQNGRVTKLRMVKE